MRLWSETSETKPLPHYALIVGGSEHNLVVIMLHPFFVIGHLGKCSFEMPEFTDLVRIISFLSVRFVFCRLRAILPGIEHA
jgi:hypothetical protein